MPKRFYLFGMRFLLQHNWIWGLVALTVLGLVVAFSLPKKKGGGTCGCQPLSDTQAIEEADLIFVGRCTYATTNWIAGGMKYSFEVENAWKRRSDQHMIVNSGWEQDCGFTFKEGEIYLVFANKAFSLQTTRCTGTRAFSPNDPVYVRLSDTEQSEIAQSPIADTMIWTIGILGVLSLLLIAVVVLRSRFKHS